MLFSFFMHMRTTHERYVPVVVFVVFVCVCVLLSVRWPSFVRRRDALCNKIFPARPWTEFWLWVRVQTGVGVSYCMTLFRLFDIPVFWPILLLYYVLSVVSGYPVGLYISYSRTALLLGPTPIIPLRYGLESPPCCPSPQQYLYRQPCPYAAGCSKLLR